MRRILNLVTWLIASAIRQPREARKRLRRVMAMLLDQRFLDNSPLKVLPESLLAQVLVQDIRLPGQQFLLPGNQPLSGLLLLASLAKALEAGVIFEIGTYNGATAFALAANVPAADVHTLDLPPGANPSLPINLPDRGNMITFDHRVFDETPESIRIHQYFGDSASFDFSEFYGRCDLVYIDGAHSYDYVANDTAQAFLMASKVSAIVWDDYWRIVPDVARYLDSRKDLDLYRVPDSRLVIWLSSGAHRRLREGSVTKHNLKT